MQNLNQKIIGHPVTISGTMAGVGANSVAMSQSLVQPRTEMSRAIERLIEARRHLQSNIEHLQDRLTPVRSPAPSGETESKQENRPGSELAQTITDEARQIEMAAAYISHIISELEI